MGVLGINFFVQFASAFLKVKIDEGTSSIGNHYAYFIGGFLLSTIFISKVFIKRFSLKNIVSIALIF
jgi:hypothetical protein